MMYFSTLALLHEVYCSRIFCYPSRPRMFWELSISLVIWSLAFLFWLLYNGWHERAFSIGGFQHDRLGLFRQHIYRNWNCMIGPFLHRTTGLVKSLSFLSLAFILSFFILLSLFLSFSFFLSTISLSSGSSIVPAGPTPSFYPSIVLLSPLHSAVPWYSSSLTHSCRVISEWGDTCRHVPPAHANKYNPVFVGVCLPPPG